MTAGDVEKLATLEAAASRRNEIAFTPSRVLMQDFTGVPAIVDLAAMRDAMEELGGDPPRSTRWCRSELVIDHSIQVDVFAEQLAFQRNAELEFERNRERYAFLRWGQTAFDNFAVVPPNTGICHQVNLEYLARVVRARDGQAFPDTLVGTDSHTTMVNGLGVLGWGVGGIEAEAAMLGQPVSMLIPQVVGFRLTGELPEGSTATDLVLTVTQMLRERGVVGQVRGVLRPGPGQPAAGRPRHDRQHVAGVRRHLRDLPGRRRDAALPRVLRAARPSGSSSSRPTAASRGCSTTRAPRSRPTATRSSSTSRHGRAVASPGPKRPQDRVALASAARGLPRGAGTSTSAERRPCSRATTRRRPSPFPASDPPHQRRRAASRPKPLAPQPRRRGRARGVPVKLADGSEFELRPRRGGDRRDHELHEHLEPRRHARRRPARQEGGRARARRAGRGSRPASRPARRSSPTTSSGPA